MHKILRQATILFFSNIIILFANTNNQEFSFEIIKQYAPLVYLDKEEEFYPSSVDYFLDNIDISFEYLITKNKIDCPSCTNLKFLQGQSLLSGNIPVYVMIVPKPNIGNDITDVFYWMFYPYNRGKRVCISPVYINGNCFGKYSTFGHHIGDWEHLTIRFKADQPIKIYLSQHTSGASFDWYDNNIEYISHSSNEPATHPVIYSARGSHALYEKSAEHVYRKIFNGYKLIDITSRGAPWYSWNNIILLNNNTYKNFNWAQYSGRWGNPKDGCKFLGLDIENMFGACILNSGPVGPIMKSYTNSQQECFSDEFYENYNEEERRQVCYSHFTEYY